MIPEKSAKKNDHACMRNYVGAEERAVTSD
jgi:hypothetical protein